MSDISGNVENVQKLLNYPAFDLHNPNNVYSLIGGFCRSPVNFHAKDGSGYKFLGDIVLQLDKINPQVFSHYPSLNYGFFYSHVIYKICISPKSLSFFGIIGS
jgi:aminopeptidase N